MIESQAAIRITRTGRSTVVQLLANQDWQLADVEELLVAVQEETSPTDTLAMLRRRAVHQYSKVLYEACCQVKDSARRDRAFYELHRYIYRAAYNRWPEWAEDITQQAMLIVVEQLDRCRQPGTFLSFALFKSRDAMKRILRDEERWRTRTAPMLETAVDPIVLSPVTSVVIDERVAEVQAALSQLSIRLQQVLLLKYEDGLDDAEIAEQLDISVNYVRVLRNRARHKLRDLLQQDGARTPRCS